jgi:hypothetical protein
MNEQQMMSKCFPDRDEKKDPITAVITKMIDTEIRKGRMPIVGNHAMPPREGRTSPPVVGDPPEILAKLSHVLRPKEKLTQFHARTGLGLSQIREMGRDEIARFVAIAATHERPAL